MASSSSPSPMNVFFFKTKKTIEKIILKNDKYLQEIEQLIASEEDGELNRDRDEERIKSLFSNIHKFIETVFNKILMLEEEGEKLNFRGFSIYLFVGIDYNHQHYNGLQYILNNLNELSERIEFVLLLDEDKENQENPINIELQLKDILSIFKGFLVNIKSLFKVKNVNQVIRLNR